MAHGGYGLYRDVACVFALLVGLMVALSAAASTRRRLDRFDNSTQQSNITGDGLKTLCVLSSAQAAQTCGGDVNLGGRMFFKDQGMSTVPTWSATPTDGDTNNSDPYYLEKVLSGPNQSSLRLTIKDDADESFQIWGNSCAAGNCAGEGTMAHKFRADGSTAHSSSMVLGSPTTASDNGWSSPSYPYGGSLNIYNRHAGNWTHFPWIDGRNYIRNDTQVDGNMEVNGTINMPNNGSGLNWSVNNNSTSHIYDDGDLHINTDDTMHLLAPSSLQVQTPTMDVNNIRFSSGWTGSTDAANGIKSEISNDVGYYKTLMIVGNRSAGGDRRVAIWDRLNVHGDMGIDGQLCIGGQCISASDIQNMKSAVTQEASLASQVSSMNSTMTQNIQQLQAGAQTSNASAGGSAVFVLGPYNMSPWGAGNFEDQLAKWIWNDPNAASGTGGGCINFNTVYTARTAITASMGIIVDDSAVVLLNGQQVGTAGGGYGGGSYQHITLNLRQGQNVINVQATNVGGAAGLLLSIRDTGSGTVILRSDQSWLAAEC